VRNLVALLASIIVLAAVSLLAQAIFPSIEYQSGNHEIATAIALGGAFLTWAIVYSLYPHVRRGGRKP
jgi:uncharacterized membrane protein YccC